MRIIKSGMLQKRYCCSFCKCEFEIDGSDIKTSITGSGLLTSSYQSDFKYVICPECGNKITVLTEGKPNVYVTADDIYNNGASRVTLTPGKMDAIQCNIGSTVGEAK